MNSLFPLVHLPLFSSRYFLQTVPIISIQNTPALCRLVLISQALTFLSLLNFFVNEAHTMPLLCVLHNALQTSFFLVLAWDAQGRHHKLMASPLSAEQTTTALFKTLLILFLVHGIHLVPSLLPRNFLALKDPYTAIFSGWILCLHARSSNPSHWS